MKEDKLGISKTDGEIFMMLDEKQAGELIRERNKKVLRKLKGRK